MGRCALYTCVCACVRVCMRTLLRLWTWQRWHHWIWKWFDQAMILLALIPSSVCVCVCWHKVNMAECACSSLDQSHSDEVISPEFNPQQNNRRALFPSLHPSPLHPFISCLFFSLQPFHLSLVYFELHLCHTHITHFFSHTFLVVPLFYSRACFFNDWTPWSSHYLILQTTVGHSRKHPFQ